MMMMDTATPQQDSHSQSSVVWLDLRWLWLPCCEAVLLGNFRELIGSEVWIIMASGLSTLMELPVSVVEPRT